MSTNKKFRIQNGADIHGGGLSIDDVIVIGADGKVVAGAIQDAVASLTAADIADLQSQVTAILGTSPETLDTLQEIVTAFQDADTNLVASVASNSADIATINATLTSGVATPADVAALDTFVKGTSSELVGDSWSVESNWTLLEAARYVGTVWPNPSYSGIFGFERKMVWEQGGHSQSTYVNNYSHTEGDFAEWVQTVTPGEEITVSLSVNKGGFGSVYVRFEENGQIIEDFHQPIYEYVNARATHSHTFTPTSSTIRIVVGDIPPSLEEPNTYSSGGAFYIEGLAITTAVPSLGTDASTVVGAVNEVHTEVDALTVAVATAKSEAISTASADATSKADAAEASAKAHADQVVAATVDAAPAALDTLNELAAALGDDANFASTVTASIATKADDAATTAALDLKEDKTVVADLDTFVKGSVTNMFSGSVNSAFWVAMQAPGTTSTTESTWVTTGSGRLGVKSTAYYAPETAMTVGNSYTLSFKAVNIASTMTVKIYGANLQSSANVYANTTVAAGDYSSSPLQVTIPFTSYDNGVTVELIGAGAGTYALEDVLVFDPSQSVETLGTTATNVVSAINEVHAELDALSATQSGDTSSLTTAIATAKSEAISTASADATAKADAAETDAKAYADQVVAATVDAAPAALDTLNELAAALGDDANFASTVTTSIATKASQVSHDAEVARATAAEVANAAAIAAANSRTSGISTSSGSTDIQMTAELDMDSNNIKNANDVYAARGFIDHIESNDLKVQTGTVDFEGSIVNFGSSTITGGGFGNATKAEIDQHLNIPTANAGEFVKWTGTDYEWTDLVSGRLATDQLQIASGGSITATGPGGTFDFQDGIVMLSGSDVRVDTPTDVGQAANKGYVDAETTLVAGDGISVDNLTHTVSLDGSAISQNLVPSDDNLYTLGSPDKVWKDVYIGPGSLYIGGQKVIEDNAGTITVNADPDQNLTVQTTGTGGLSVQSTGSGGISIDAASEAVQVKSDMVVSVGKTITTVGGAATKFGGDIDMQTNTVSGLGAPSMDADAATKLYVDDRIAEGTISGSKTFSDNVIVSGNLTVSGTTTTVNSETISLADNIIDLNSNLTSGDPSEDAGIRIMRGDASAVQLRWNETSDHWETYNGSAWTKIALSTSDLAEGSNQYFTEERAKACLTGGLCITYSSVTGEIKVDQAEAESTLRVAESVASDDADKLDGQEGTYYRINVYNVAGTLVN